MYNVTQTCHSVSTPSRNVHIHPRVIVPPVVCQRHSVSTQRDSITPTIVISSSLLQFVNFIMENIEEIVGILFKFGLTQRETLNVLSDWGMCIGRTKLRKILRVSNLRRRTYDDVSLATEFIVNEQRSSGCLHGYRWMHQKCKDNNISVRKEDIRLLLRRIDPEGTIMRRARRLQRRDYFSAGPNFIWHVDSYDKIKPFGLCINGCIDGFSRRIMWMNVYYTSSDPKVVCGYFIETVQKFGCPRLVRADMGTENTCIRDIQNFLAINATVTSQSGFLTGPSTANQRIECFWGQLRKECMEFWLCHFHDLQNNGYYTAISSIKIYFCSATSP